MPRRSSILALTMVAFAGSAPSASAQSCDAPPGISAIDQYCEVVPDGAGGSAGDGADAGVGPASGNGATIAPRTQRRLQSTGSDGRALARLLQGDDAVRPEVGGGDDRAGRQDDDVRPAGSLGPEKDTISRQSNNVLAAAARSAGDEAGRVGEGFGAALIAAIAVMGFFGYARSRRSPAR